jgi:hypothetical protein
MVIYQAFSNGTAAQYNGGKNTGKYNMLPDSQ